MQAKNWAQYDEEESDNKEVVRRNTDFVPPTSERVPKHTDEEINERINRQTEANVAYFAQGDSRLIRLRLLALDQEWDIERILEANAGTVALAGLVLERFINRG